MFKIETNIKERKKGSARISRVLECSTRFEDSMATYFYDAKRVRASLMPSFFFFLFFPNDTKRRRCQVDKNRANFIHLIYVYLYIYTLPIYAFYSRPASYSLLLFILWVRFFFFK